MIEKLYTVEEVAELASVTGRTIRNYLKSGRLVGRKIGGQWRFPEAEVQRLLTGGQIDDRDSEAPLAKPSSASVAVTFPQEDESAYDEDFEISQAQEGIASPPAQPLARPSQYYTEPAPLPGTARPAKTEHPAAPAAVPTAPEPSPYPSGYPVYPQPSAPQAAPVVSSPSSPAPVYGQPVYPNAPVTPYYNNTSFSSEPLMAQPVQQPPYYQSPALAGQVGQPYPAAPAGYNASQPSYYPASQRPSYDAVPPADTSNAIPSAPSSAPGAGLADDKSRESTEKIQTDSTIAAAHLSDIGNRVVKYISEVHDYSKGPQMCTVIDLHQSFSAARITSQRLADIADEESEAGLLCQSFVEFDERFYVARYTLFGTTSFLLRCLKLIG